MLKDKVSFLEQKIQRDLFPMLEEELSLRLLDCHRKVIQTLETIQIEKLVPASLPFSRGRPAKHRKAMARAFLAKHVLRIPTTEHLIHRLKVDKQLRYLCGWNPGEKVPSESSFCRLFSYLSQSNALGNLLGDLFENAYEGNIVLHCGRDSVPIPVRERAPKKEKKAKFDRKWCRSKEGKKLSVCEFQESETDSQEEMEKLLPTSCAIGKKTKPSGMSIMWRGYKLHMDVADGYLPMSCILSSANTHDSQAAIPLSKKSSERAPVLYELMDSAYDVKAIRKYLTDRNRVPIIKLHKRKNGERKELIISNELAHKRLNWWPAEEVRLRHRMANERLFARLTDSFLSSNIYVRGHSKVFCHVMFGVLCLFASELLRFT